MLYRLLYVSPALARVVISSDVEPRGVEKPQIAAALEAASGTPPIDDAG